MKCPFCAGEDSQVLESRTVEEGSAIRRRRECGKCGKRFTTFEKVRDTVLWVIKKNGRREPFEREKVKRGVLRAIEKRPVSLELVDAVVERLKERCSEGERKRSPRK